MGMFGDLVGGLMGQKAAENDAKRLTAAGRESSDLAEFKPYSVTSGYGTSIFDKDSQTATYTLDPRLAQYRDQLYGLNEQAMGDINLDTNQAAQTYYNQQQGLMAGSRGAEDIALRQQQLASGRIGLGLSGAAMGAGAGTGYVNPEQYQRDLARAQVDAQLAASADQTARQRLDEDIARATGLFSVGTGVEQLGYNTMDTGAKYGAYQAEAGNNQGKLLYQGLSGASESYKTGDIAEANMWSKLIPF
jgi:hypothetical protein